MRANPRDWRITTLESVAASFGVNVRKPGDSDVVFEHPDVAEALSDGETIEVAIANEGDAKTASNAAMREPGRPVPPVASPRQPPTRLPWQPAQSSNCPIRSMVPGAKSNHRHCDFQSQKIARHTAA